MLPQNYSVLRYVGTATLLSILLGGWFDQALVYQYNHLLFLSSFRYAAQTLTAPGGLAQYVAASWSEICSNPWAGAITSGVLLGGGGAILGYMSRGSNDRWSLGYIAPWIITAGVCHPEFLGAASTWLITLCWAGLWVRGKAKPHIAWVVVVLSYFSGGGLALLLATGLVCTRLLIDRREKRWVGWVVGAAVCLPVGASWLYDIPIPTAYAVGASFSWWALGFSLVTVVVGNWAPKRCAAELWWGWVAFGLVSLIGSAGTLRQDNQRILAIIQLEQQLLDGQWSALEEDAQQFVAQYGQNRVVAFLYNTALVRQGKLLDQLFDRPQAYRAAGLLFAQIEGHEHNPHLGAKLYVENFRNAGCEFEVDRQQITTQDTMRREALEYFTAIYLLDNRIEAIKQLAPQWNRLHPIEPIPEVVQQALLAIDDDFRAEAHIKQEYRQFLAEQRRGNNNPNAISPHLRDTYWFYTLCLEQQQPSELSSLGFWVRLVAPYQTTHLSVVGYSIR